MKGTVVNISGRECRLYKDSNAEFLLVQPTDNKPFAKSIYLSLGDKAEKTKNPVMAQVGNAIRKLNELLTEQIDNTVLEWNPGNHFIDSEKRTAKGFAWVMNESSLTAHRMISASPNGIC